MPYIKYDCPVCGEQFNMSQYMDIIRHLESHIQFLTGVEWPEVKKEESA